ncbi:MAG: 2',3'-cyclic-nucleotide 2'-phosphodiesterase (5'-nucleotidase family) [Bacteroidia bacterium]
MYSRFIFAILFFGAVFCSSCHRSAFTKASEAHLQKLDTSWSVTHKKINSIISPYKAQIDSQMNVVVGYAAFEMIKSRPESALGNGICDMLMQYGVSKINQDLDLCIMNYGGLRASIPKGEVTVGRIFELMPFDNTLVIVELDSTDLRLLAKHILIKGGEPIAGNAHTSIVNYESGACFTSKDKRFQKNKTYRVLTSNYLADGGDGYAVFVGKPKTETDILIRQALITQFKATTVENPFTSEVDGRIIWNPHNE